jgi:hypothetical protein
MPQRTIAPGGGNWNSTATWVEGAVPTTSDFVVGDASSGNLTVNVATANIQYFDFTNYNGNITFTTTSNRINFVGSAGTSIFGSGTTYTYTGGFGALTGFRKASSANGNIQQYGTTNIGVLNVAASGTITLLSDLYLNHIYLSFGAAGYGLNGNSIFVDSNIDVGGGIAPAGNTILKLVGTGASTLNFTQTSSIPVVIDTSGGTTTIATNGFGSNNLTHLSGNITNPLLRPGQSSLAQTHNYDLVSGTSWNMQNLFNSTAANRTINLIQPVSFDLFQVAANRQTAIPPSCILSGSSYNITNFLITRDTTASGTGTRCGTVIEISPTTTLNVSTLFESDGGLNIRQFVFPAYTFKSNVAGNPATLNINTFNQSINNTIFTDITCAGGNKVYGVNLTLTNTTNIENITLPLSAGGQTAYTFAS